MAHQLQQIMALPLGRVVFAAAVMAPVVVLYLAVTALELRKQLTYQMRRIAFLRGEITSNQLVGLEPLPSAAAATGERVLH